MRPKSIGRLKTALIGGVLALNLGCGGENKPPANPEQKPLLGEKADLSAPLQKYFGKLIDFIYQKGFFEDLRINIFGILPDEESPTNFPGTTSNIPPENVSGRREEPNDCTEGGHYTWVRYDGPNGESIYVTTTDLTPMESSIEEACRSKLEAQNFPPTILSFEGKIISLQQTCTIVDQSNTYLANPEIPSNISEQAKQTFCVTHRIYIGGETVTFSLVSKLPEKYQSAEFTGWELHQTEIIVEAQETEEGFYLAANIDDPTPPGKDINDTSHRGTFNDRREIDGFQFFETVDFTTNLGRSAERFINRIGSF